MRLLSGRGRLGDMIKTSGEMRRHNGYYSDLQHD
jgi:hypothetical protein